MIPPNGCRYCGHLERGHGQRYDGQHPRGRNGYAAPADVVRWRRMLINRMRRQGVIK